MLAFIPLALLLLLSHVDAKQNKPFALEAEGQKPGRWLGLHLSNQPALRRRDAQSLDAGISQLALSADGSSYYTVLEIGNISFRLSLDTGSSDLWVLSSACTSKDFCKSLPSYPLSFQSPSFEAINSNQTTFNISFADGTISSGFLAKETVQLNNFSIPNQVIGFVNATNVTLESEISGVLGMGFPRLSAFPSLISNSTPFINGLAQQGLLDYPMFGLSLTRQSNGTLTLGAIDAGVVKNVSSIEWHKVMSFSPFGSESNTSSYLQWAVRMPGFGVNGTTFKTNPTYPNITETSLALLDVGTNGIFGPYQDVSRLFSSIGEARLVDSEVGQWALPCDTEEVLSFNFGQGNFTLQPTDFLIGPIIEDPSFCLTWPRAVQNAGDGIDWQLGAPFLRTVYSIFSYGIDGKEPPMIGFYPLSNVTTFSENSSYISAFFSSASATVTTTLPNVLLPTPSASTASYLFNTSIPASAGAVVSSALGASTYSALLTATSVNASALPTITLSPALVTLLVTGASGMVITTTSAAPSSSIALGVPPGDRSANSALLAIGIYHTKAYFLTSFAS
ncbi:hypothetical protein EW145_g2211 [Phellinidium pouzarii]|uniref:Peptidase A1 domain-containing protein n=1 Tax=Phellinidium pouzarii TaxID=167371 RepID=A0A4S4LH75_9AGAM|nr:hypothetical protein EW145_g2211 [Phellinidium pouzarii]